MTRRTLSLAVALVFLFFAVSPAPGADPIKIGFLAPMTGLFAQAGKDMLDGLKMGLEASGGQVAGRKLELIDEDTEGNPATAQAKYRKLVAAGQDQRPHRRAAGQHRLRPDPADRARRAARRCSSPRPTSSPSASRRSGSCVPTSRPASPCTRSATTRPRSSSTSASPCSAWTTPSATSSSGAFSACSRTPAGAWCRRRGCRSTPWTSRRISARCRATSTPSCRCSSPARPCASPSSTRRPGSRTSCRSSAPACTSTNPRCARWATRRSVPWARSCGRPP